MLYILPVLTFILGVFIIIIEQNQRKRSKLIKEMQWSDKDIQECKSRPIIEFNMIKK